MAPEHVNRDAVRERVVGLFETYGRDGVCVTTVREEPDTSFEALRGYAVDDDYLGGAYAFVVRTPEQHPGFSDTMPEDASTDGDRVLLALGRTHETWRPAGGGRETGESFAATAEREVREETGVACTVTDLQGIRRVVVEDPGSGNEIHLAYVVFEAEYASGSIDVQEIEVGGAGWFDSLPVRRHEYVRYFAPEWSRRREAIATDRTGSGR
jgi:8-oxo-dGTP pyrophosphatase MutT (NUDIX family)